MNTEPPVPLAAPGLVNVANVLTTLRLCLVPVFIVCLLAGGDGWRIAACVIFGLASATDFLDGELARRRGLITDFGKIADPIADKALTGSALVVLSYLGELPWWVTGVILVPGAGRHRPALLGHLPWRHRREPRRQGEDAAAGDRDRALILPGPFGVVRELVMAAALVVTVVTGADYAARAVRLRRATAHGGSAAG